MFQACAQACKSDRLNPVDPQGAVGARGERARLTPPPPPCASQSLLSLLDGVYMQVCSFPYYGSKWRPVRAAITTITLYSKTVPAGDAPLAACVSAATMSMFVPPCPLIDSDRASHPPNSISDPSLSENLPEALALAPPPPSSSSSAISRRVVVLTLAVTPGAARPSPAAVHPGPVATQPIGNGHLSGPPVGGQPN